MIQMVIGTVVVCLVCHLDGIMNMLRKNGRNGYVIWGGEGLMPQQRIPAYIPSANAASTRGCTTSDNPVSDSTTLTKLDSSVRR